MAYEQQHIPPKLSVQSCDFFIGNHPQPTPLVELFSYFFLPCPIWLPYHTTSEVSSYHHVWFSSYRNQASGNKQQTLPGLSPVILCVQDHFHSCLSPILYDAISFTVTDYMHVKWSLTWPCQWYIYVSSCSTLWSISNICYLEYLLWII